VDELVEKRKETYLGGQLPSLLCRLQTTHVDQVDLDLMSWVVDLLCFHHIVNEYVLVDDPAKWVLVSNVVLECEFLSPEVVHLHEIHSVSRESVFFTARSDDLWN